MRLFHINTNTQRKNAHKMVKTSTQLQTDTGLKHIFSIKSDFYRNLSSMLQQNHSEFYLCAEQL